MFSSATVMYSYSRYIANHVGIEPPTWLSEMSYTCCSVTYVPLISSTTAPGGATNTSNSKWSSGTKPVNRFLLRDKTRVLLKRTLCSNAAGSPLVSDGKSPVSALFSRYRYVN